MQTDEPVLVVYSGIYFGCTWLNYDNHKLTHFHFLRHRLSGLQFMAGGFHVHLMIRLNTLTFKLAIKINAQGHIVFTPLKELGNFLHFIDMLTGPCVHILLNRYLHTAAEF